MTIQDKIFPVGYFAFNKNQAYNYQLNRWHSLGLINYDDIQSSCFHIKTFEDWKTQMTKLAEQAESEGRLLNSAFYYRAAEFYSINESNADKIQFYDKFATLFYRAISLDSIERTFIPYMDNFLIPILKVRAQGHCLGTIIIHGGFDSFIEEFYHIMKAFSDIGYDVIGFEGPGQGHMLLKQGVPLDYQWEKPVSTIIDYYNLNKVTLFGLSMGGWFCLRASAYEPRIKNVIASGHAVDYSRIPPAFARWLMIFFIKNYRSYTANSFCKIANKGGIKGWQVSNLAHITGMEPLESFEYSLNLNADNLSCHRIKQNVLYLTGRHDHFVPFKMHAQQLALLTNAHSLTDRVYTKKEHADNHCQIGNVKLMLDDIIRWLSTHS